MPPTHHARRIKLINAPLQIKLTSIFVGMSALSLLLQVLLFTKCLSDVAQKLPSDGPLLWAEMRSTLLWIFFTSTLAFLPLIFLIGVLTTFRIAGPLSRLESHLRSIVQGEAPGPLQVRKGDELQGVAELLNRALEVTSARAALPARPSADRRPAETAA
jgi:hypothetical protein